MIISIFRWKRSSSMSLRCDPWIECWKWIKTKTTQFRSNCYQKNAKNHLTNIWLIIKILTKQGQSGTWLVGLGWILRRSIKKDFLLSGSGTMFYGGGAIKTGPRRQPLGVKLFYYNLSPQPCSSFLALVPFLIWLESWVENGLNILNLFPVQGGVNCGPEKVCKKWGLQRTWKEWNEAGQ